MGEGVVDAIIVSASGCLDVVGSSWTSWSMVPKDGESKSTMLWGRSGCPRG